MLKTEQSNPVLKKKSKDWYLIQTKPSLHLIASKNLKRQGFDVFLPLMIKTSKKGRKFVQNKIPLFPNYLFIGSKLKLLPWKSINSTRGVAKAVTMDGVYRAIKVELIEGLKSRCDMGNVIRTEVDISCGDTVKIEQGPLAEFICKVDKFADGERVWVLIDIMQQQARTLVATRKLSKIN